MKSVSSHETETNLSGAQASTLETLAEREFIFVTGKGGVGKSSVTAALGSFAAKRGRRVLVTYPAGTSAPAYEWNQALSESPTEVEPGLSVVRLDPELAMRQYVTDALGSERLASVLFHNRVARGFLTGIPGPRDWAMLGRAWSFSKNSTYESKRPVPRYDLVIMDGPSSGDGANMLRVPEVILDLAVGARLRKDAESCLSMLRDPERTAIVLVTLSEELPLKETEEALAVLRGEMRLPVGALVVNETLNYRFTEEDRDLLLSLSSKGPSTAEEGTSPGNDLSPQGVRTRNILSAATRRAEAEARQCANEKRIEGLHLPVIRLPAVSFETREIDRIQKLQISLAEGH